MTPKENLKKKIAELQNGNCALTYAELSKEPSEFDTDRITPKADGGIYTDENTRVVDPVAHMERHGNLREREEELEQLKTLIDAREQIRKFSNSANNRILAMKRRTDILDQETLKWLGEKSEEGSTELSTIDKRIIKHLSSMKHPMVKIALRIKGVGPITVAYMLTYIDIRKAEHASSVWKYCGYHCASHERYEKGVAGGGNKTLRTVLYTMADSMIKTRSIYRAVYDAEKARLEVSERLIKSYNTQGKLIECMWKDTKPCHRHMAAMRKMIKHFLADWWLIHRTVEGLPTTPLYVEEKLGHTGIIRPAQRGWEY